MVITQKTETLSADRVHVSHTIKCDYNMQIALKYKEKQIQILHIVSRQQAGWQSATLPPFHSCHPATLLLPPCHFTFATFPLYLPATPPLPTWCG
jgi:hypothetical protein